MEFVVPSSSGFRRFTRRAGTALLCVAALFAVGCHNHTLNSGAGNVFVTLTSDPGDFSSYIVNIDSIYLNRNDGAQVPALQTAETVDFAKLNNYAELLQTAEVATGTYLSATITLDYTSAVISVPVNGKPVLATVHNSTGVVPTTIVVTVLLDPATANALTLVPTYATTAAVRLALKLDLAASTPPIDLSTGTPVVIVKPYFTAAIAPSDTKMIRVRGPLINSSVNLLTYTVYERPFYDEQYTLGTLTIFTDASTVYETNGVISTGVTGLTQLSQSSAGTTVTAAFTTYEPTLTPSATAAKFHAKYVIAGSTLEDVYTQGLEGDVIARSGNTLTLQSATLFVNDGLSYYSTDWPTSLTATSIYATVNVGPKTVVTIDGAATNAGLDYNSVAVGQHIIVRGLYSLPSGVVTIDATSAQYLNTGSVRLLSTYLWGQFRSCDDGGPDAQLTDHQRLPGQ